MYASGITYTSVASVSPASTTLTGADNGLSPSTVTGGNVVLGQDVGEAGDPAMLLSNREIPMNGFDITFADATTAHAHLSLPGLYFNNWWTGPDGQPVHISTYGSPMVVQTNNYSAGFEEYSFVTAAAGFFGYLGVQSWAYVTGENGATHNKFIDGYINAFSGALVWDGSGGAGNQHLGNTIGLFSALNSQSGTIANAFDVYASELNSTGQTTLPPNVTNHYGFYMEACTKATNNYGVYVLGNQINFMNGRLGLGNNNPSAILMIKAGTATAGTAPLKFTAGTNLTTPEAGAVEYDGHLFAVTPVGSTRLALNLCLFTQTQTVTVANTTTETSILGTGVGTKILPANFLTAGRTVKILAYGIHSAVANPNITINVKLNGVTITTTGVVASGNSTNAYTEIRAEFTCYTTGAGGTLWVQGAYTEGGTGANIFPMSTTAAVAVDTTVAQTIDVTLTWGTASVSDTSTYTNVTIQVFN